MTSHADGITEEPWESELSALFGGLGDVEPPPGFLDSAVNHRPLYAGRITGALMMCGLLALALASWTGLVGNRSVSPDVAQMALRHNLVLRDGLPASDSADPPAVPEERFQHQGTVDTSDFSQSLYELDGRSVSVFSQRGEVDPDTLPGNDFTEVADSTAWASGDVLVVQSQGQAVTLIGVPADQFAAVLADFEQMGLTGAGGVVDRLARTLNGLTTNIGFPEAG